MCVSSNCVGNTVNKGSMILFFWFIQPNKWTFPRHPSPRHIPSGFPKEIVFTLSKKNMCVLEVEPVHLNLFQLANCPLEDWLVIRYGKLIDDMLASWHMEYWQLGFVGSRISWVYMHMARISWWISAKRILGGPRTPRKWIDQWLGSIWLFHLRIYFYMGDSLGVK